MNRGWIEANRDAAARFLRALVEATTFIESNRDEAARQVARFLRQDRGLVGELMGKVGYRMDLTADSVANIQLAIGQLRGMGRLAKEVTPAQVIWPEALRAAAPHRVEVVWKRVGWRRPARAQSPLAARDVLRAPGLRPGRRRSRPRRP